MQHRSPAITAESGDDGNHCLRAAFLLVDLPEKPYFAGMKATVTSKGQITIPLAIRRRLNLQPGTILDFDEKATCLKATKYHNLESMRSVVGCAKDQMPGISSAQWLEATRGPVELPKRKHARRP